MRWEESIKYCCCILNSDSCLEEKHLFSCFELQAQLDIFFMEHDLKEWLADENWLFKYGYLADIFFEMNEVNYHFKKNN